MHKKTDYKKVIKNLTKAEKTIIIVLCAAIVVGLGVAGVLLLGGGGKEPEQEVGQQIELEDTENVEQEEPVQDEQEEVEQEETKEPAETEQEEPENVDADPQEVLSEKEEGVSVDVNQVINENETKEVTHGIDVSKYQGTIDWAAVADTGIDFAMIRVGYRNMSDGAIVADSNAKFNMQEAQKNGIKVGVYFFSTAMNAEEAKEEANWVADYISQYKITYPVAYDCEGFQKAESRQYEMTKTERTDAALAFMNQIEQRGYSAMFYAAKGEMEAEAEWEVSRISSLYKVWVAQYPGTPYPETESASYSGTHAMWQYTNNGQIPGVDKPVDVNVAYFGYEKEEEAQNEEAPEEVDADVEALMKFTNVDEKVTAKDKTNLRDIPSQGDDSNVMAVLKNGDEARRTGISDSGWSRLEVNGETYYAVSSYLTTDLSYEPPKEEEDDGIVTEFTAVSEKVTAKEVVNLRTLPSVTNEASSVVAQLNNGDVAVRTGINNELGWSRLEYEGQTLYCISSYLKSAETE